MNTDVMKNLRKLNMAYALAFYEPTKEAMDIAKKCGSVLIVTEWTIELAEYNKDDKFKYESDGKDVIDKILYIAFPREIGMLK